MSDNRDISSKIVVLHNRPEPHALMKVNRWLLLVVFFLMTVIVIAGLVLMPQDGINSYKKASSTEAYLAEKNPVLSAEVNTLKGQFVGLVSGSIESKLRTLEEAVRLGAASESLRAIEDLKTEIKVLRSYSEPVKAEQTLVANEHLMQEMSELKRLVYLTLVSCGLMIAFIAGIWIKHNRLTYKEIVTRHLGKH